MPPRSIEDYQVGWVCALPKEMAAARAMLDEEHGPMPSQDTQDHNNYVLGHVHNHNVVIACLPAGVDGNNAAATVATNMLRTFTGLRFGLVVGIGGGIPNLDKGVDIRLGDVVVSQPDKTHGGVVQYDKGKSLEGGQFERKGSLNKPPSLLLTALASLQAQHEVYGSQISMSLTRMIEKYPHMEENGYAFPGVEQDCLYCAACKPVRINLCENCQDGKVCRKERRHTKPVIHYGIIASGNQVVKDALVRDRLGQEFEAKCVEMEAAGLMDDFPCLVIRGVCDYADTHKNDVWHRYAATTAAAYAKEFLSIVLPKAVLQVSHASDVMKYNLGLNLFDAPDMDEGLFFGREAESQYMESTLQPQSDSPGLARKVLILGGTGGIGKTQLVINFAKQHRTSYSSILWLNATSEATLNTSLRNVANRIFLPEMVSKLEDGDQLRIHVSNWLSKQDNTQWLLIFDNHDNPDEYNITDYYPSSSHGSIIVTTRQPRRLNGQKIKVESMSKHEDGLEILAARSGRHNVQSDSGAHDLAKRLDGFPLALATAGAFLKESSVSFSKYLQQYEARWEVIPGDTEELPDYPTRTLYTTWNLSLAQIKEQEPQAAELLSFLAYLDYQDIWYELLCAGQEAERPLWFTELICDEFAFERAMKTLTRYCLVDAHHQSGSYSLHVCIHDWTLDGLNQCIDGIKYWLAADCVVSHINDVKWNDLSGLEYRRFNRHVKRLGHDRFQEISKQYSLSPERLTKIGNAANFLAQQVQYKVANRMYLLQLAEKEKALGPDHPSTLGTVHNLGILYADQGKLAEAEQMHQRALVGSEKALGPDHPSTLSTVHSLGNLYVRQDKLAEAEQMYQRALAGKAKVLGPDHTSTLGTVHNLGILYINQGKLAEAERMYVRALAGNEKALGPDHPSTLGTVHSLGNLYVRQGKLAEAEQMYQRALAGKEKALGPDHTVTLETVHNLGILHINQGKLAGAERMFVQVLARDEKALGPDHMSTLGTVHNLGILYADQDKVAEAEQMFIRALAGNQKALGPDHTSTLNTVYNLGILYADQDKPAEAEQMFTRALAGHEKALGPNHISTLATVDNLKNLKNL